jgi:hypothetical protein
MFKRNRQGSLYNIEYKKNEALIEYVKKNLPEETELLRMLEEK